MSTRDTMPCMIWVSEVVGAARCSVADMETYLGRARLHRWYNDGMPVWMAADSLAHAVRYGKKYALADKRGF